MRFERLTSKDHPLYEKALELYRISFPAHEQREASSQADILSDEQYHFTLVYHDDAFAGLILFWETQKFIYVEHFCILPQMRNQKLGQTALQLLSQRQKAVILEIDPPDDEISQRRKRFYERCGFLDNPYAHVHPPYHRGIAGHALVIMSAPHRLSQNEYDAFRLYLDRHVMENAFS